MKEFPDVIAWSIPAFVLLVVLERVSYRLHRDDDEVGYGGADTATSLAMGLGSIFVDLLWKVPIAAAYALLYALTPLRVAELWWTWPLILLAQDFFYYWSHRGHHVIRILWASTSCTTPVAAVQPLHRAAPALDRPDRWPFYIPLIALGVHPAAVAFCASVNLRLPVLDPHRADRQDAALVRVVFNTPSHHRVHHASQGGYLDRNFGGILIVWDRLFGSFAPETGAPRVRPDQEHRHATTRSGWPSTSTPRSPGTCAPRRPGGTGSGISSAARAGSRHRASRVRAAGPARPDGRTSSAPG